MMLTACAAVLTLLAMLLARPARPALTGRREVPRSSGRVGPDPPRLDADGVAELAEQVAALSRAGLPTQRLWRVLAGEPEAVGEPGAAGGSPIAEVAEVVARVVALGGTEAQGLRVAGGGYGPLAWMALACDVSHTSGAPPAGVLDGIAVTLRAEREAAREREAALAGPRTTATVLTWLPLAGLGLGLLTGADAIGVLVATAAGRGCLVIAGLLWIAGRLWMSRMLRRAESPDLQSVR